jgi:hypothetical protein
MVEYTKLIHRGVPGGMATVSAQSAALTAAGLVAGGEAATADTLKTPRNLSVVGGATVSFDGSANAILPSGVQFGTGAPTTLIGEGVIYFDTTGSPYVQYVQHSGAWHAA